MNTSNDKQLQLFSTPEPSSEPSFYDWEIDQEGYENSIGISGYEQPQSEAKTLHLNDNTNTRCSDTWISFQAVEASALQQSSLGEYEQLSLWRSTPTLRQFSNTTSQEYQFTQTLGTTTQNQDNLTSLAVDSRVQAHQTLEAEQDFSIQLPLFGEKDLDALLKLNPASVLSNNLKELLNEDFELFLADFLWQDTLGKLAMCRAFGSDRRKTTGKALLSAQQSLARVIKDSDYLSTRRLDVLLNQKHPPPSFPTLTSNVSSTSRPAGQTKCDRWFKDNGLIPSGYQLGTRAIALTMGFLSSWFEGLTQQYSNKTNTQSRVKPQAESEPGIWQDEQLHFTHKQRLPSVESSTSTRSRHPNSVRMLETTAVLLGGEHNSLLSTENSSSVNKGLSIPCLVKQLKQPEVKGIIRKVLRDRFLVEVDGEEISVFKLFVYPDFSTQRASDKSAGQIEKNPRKNITPSKENPRKTRRKKGQGNGTIYYRTVTKKGSEYQEAYYHYRSNGKKRTKYIPKKLLSRVEEAESLKLPVSEILILLGGDKKNPRKSSSTSIDKVEQKINDGCIEQVLETNNLNPRKTTPPSKRKRKQGEGTGYIECKPIKRSGKEYKQYWYHYEEWRSGDRTSKKSRYIPKRLVARVEKMEAEKVSVREILEALISKGKRSQK